MPDPPVPIPTPSVVAVGPYSPAVRSGDWVVCSGQIGIDPSTGKLAKDFGGQVRQALVNLSAVLADCGCGWEHVAKATLFLTADAMQWMDRVNPIYEQTLGVHRPARSTVGVAMLPMGAMFEIEVWAYAPPR